jgi:phosphatidylinositol 4-kinase
MIDTAGHIIHIDFGFVFGLAPGKQFSMEQAPWKLTREMAQVMGDQNSPEFAEYTKMCVQALLVARKHAAQVVAMMEIMMFHSNYPAFK